MSSIKIYEYTTGAANADVTDLDSLIFRSTDALSTNQDLSVGPIKAPITGTSRSFEKILRIHIDWDVADTDKISNIQALTSFNGVLDFTGVAFSGGLAENFTDPVETDSAIATESLQLKNGVNPFLLTTPDEKYGLAAPQNDEHVQVDDLGAVGSYLYLQMDVLPSVTLGDFHESYGAFSLVIRYDVES